MFLDWLEDSLPVHSQHGDEVVTDCPACGKDKCWINTDTGQFTCYVCAFGGSIYALMYEAEGIEKSEARRIIGVDKDVHHGNPDALIQIFQTEPEQNGNSLTGVTSPAAPEAFPEEVHWYGTPYELCQADADAGQAGWDAMIARGFTPEIILNNRAGWCWQGQFKNRVILPVFREGRCVWWQAWDYAKQYGNIKYLNPTNESVPFGRKELVYNIERWHDVSSLVICEGIFNCWALEQAGYAAVCTFGKLMSTAQRNQILNHPAQTIYIGLDPDAIEQAQDLFGVFSSFGKDTRLCTLPWGEDFNDLPLQQRVGVLEAAGSPDWLFGA